MKDLYIVHKELPGRFTEDFIELFNFLINMSVEVKI